jgi:hypothetical protein
MNDDKIDLDNAAAVAGKKGAHQKEAKDSKMFDKTPGKEATEKGSRKNAIGNLSEDLFEE